MKEFMYKNKVVSCETSIWNFNDASTEDIVDWRTVPFDKKGKPYGFFSRLFLRDCRMFVSGYTYRIPSHSYSTSSAGTGVGTKFTDLPDRYQEFSFKDKSSLSSFKDILNENLKNSLEPR